MKKTGTVNNSWGEINVDIIVDPKLSVNQDCDIPLKKCSNLCSISRCRFQIKESQISKQTFLARPHLKYYPHFQVIILF